MPPEDVRHGITNRFPDVAHTIRDWVDVRVPAVERIVLVLAPEVRAGVARRHATCNAMRHATRVTVEGPSLSADARTALTHRSPVLLPGPRPWTKE